MKITQSFKIAISFLFIFLVEKSFSQETFFAKTIKTTTGHVAKNQKIKLRVSVLNPEKNCLLYAEDFTDLKTNNQGVATFHIGEGKKLFPESSIVKYSDVFEENQIFECAQEGRYFDSINENKRYIVIQYNVLSESKWQLIKPFLDNL